MDAFAVADTDNMQIPEKLDNKELISILVAALSHAKQHLEWCNYGDSWEHECAIEAGLPKQLEEALDLCKQLKS